MVEVVLETDGEDAAGGPVRRTRRVADAAPDDAGSAAGRGRRRRRATLVALLAVGVVTAANVAETVREDRRDALLAAMPGTVGDLDAPLTVRWESAVVPTSGLAGELVLSADGTGADGRLVAVDVRTGEERWSVPRGSSGAVDWCEGAVGDSARPLVLCWRAALVTRDVGGDATFEPTRMVLLDARDGSVVAEHERDLPAAGHGVVGGDVVVADRDRRTVTVARVDPRTNTTRWSVEVPLEAQLADGSYSAFLQVTEEIITVAGPTTVVLDADDGTELMTWHADGVALTGTQGTSGADVVATGRGFGVWTGIADGRRTPEGRWYALDGTPGPALDGFVAEPDVDDGALPEIVLLRDPDATTLTAVDVATGGPLWSTPLDGGRAVLRREGAVVLAAEGVLRAVDLRTGQPRWSAEVPGLRPEVGSVTDGRSVVVAARQGGRWVLQAVRLDDGVLGWTAAAPPTTADDDAPPTLGTAALVQVAGQVLYGRGGELAGLG